jgi:hypothetical protein
MREECPWHRCSPGTHRCRRRSCQGSPRPGDHSTDRPGRPHRPRRSMIRPKGNPTSRTPHRARRRREANERATRDALCRHTAHVRGEVNPGDPLLRRGGHMNRPVVTFDHVGPPRPRRRRDPVSRRLRGVAVSDDGAGDRRGFEQHGLNRRSVRPARHLPLRGLGAHVATRDALAGHDERVLGRLRTSGGHGGTAGQLTNAAGAFTAPAAWASSRACSIRAASTTRSCR